MSIDLDTGNGRLAAADMPSTSAEPSTPHFSEWSLRRLGRLHARMLGAQEVAEVALQAARATGDRFHEALAESCDEIGITLPPGPIQAHIDWRTGAFSLGADGDADPERSSS